MLSRAIRAGVAALAAVTTLSGAVACGAPEFTYVKNSGEKTYFKVPHEWHEIAEDDADELNAALMGVAAESGTAAQLRDHSWSTAYDAAAEPSAAHLLSTRATDDPIVFARVQDLTVTERDATSLDTLRNVFLPVTDAARQAFTEAGATGLTGFELLSDEVLTPSHGVRGVRVVYNYDLGGVLHTFDQTAYVNNAGDKQYLMVLRCSARCYQDRKDELATIVDSFTVRSDS